MCYGAEAPWRLLGVSESDLDSRVELTPDQCVVDGRQFFIRGHLPITVIGASSPFLWSVWCSLSERSFEHMTSRWTSTDRLNDAPYFGWLMTRLPGYPETLHLQASVQSRAVGEVPRITVFDPPDHPLAMEQRDGITMTRVREFARLVLHSHGGA